MFLKKVFNTNKPLFWFLALFIAGQGFFTYKGVETFPFFNWGMYSGQYTSQESHTVYQIKINGSPVKYEEVSNKNWFNLQKMLDYYKTLKDNNWQDPMDKVIEQRTGFYFPTSYKAIVYRQISNTGLSNELFQQWLKEYLQTHFTSAIIETFEINLLSLSYSNESVTLVDSNVLLGFHDK